MCVSFEKYSWNPSWRWPSNIFDPRFLLDAVRMVSLSGITHCQNRGIDRKTSKVVESFKLKFKLNLVRFFLLRVSPVWRRISESETNLVVTKLVCQMTQKRNEKSFQLESCGGLPRLFKKAHWFIVSTWSSLETLLEPLAQFPFDQHFVRVRLSHH